MNHFRTLQAHGEHAAQLHAMAANAFPEIGKMDPERFAALLSTTEMALGSALLTHASCRLYR